MDAPLRPEIKREKTLSEVDLKTLMSVHRLWSYWCGNPTRWNFGA